MKIYLKRFLLSLLLLNLTLNAYSATKFVCKIGCNTTNCSGTEDYDNMATMESLMDGYGNLTDGLLVTGDWDNQSGGDIADEASVTFDGTGGTLVHMTNHAGTTEDTYLIKCTDADACTALSDNDTIDDGGGNTFDIKGSPDSVILVAEFYNDDGAIAGMNDGWRGFTTDDTNYVMMDVGVGEEHDGVYDAGVVCTSSNLGFRSTDSGRIRGIQLSDSCGEYHYDIDGTQIWSDLIFDNVGGMGTNSYSGTLYIQNSIIDDSDQGELLYCRGPTFLQNSVMHCGSRCTRNCGTIQNSYGHSTSGPVVWYAYTTVTTSGANDATGNPAGLDNLTTSDQFNGYDTEDWSLKVGAALIDAATDLSGTFTTDVEGTTRTVDWDVGIYDYITISGNPAATNSFFQSATFQDGTFQ